MEPTVGHVVFRCGEWAVNETDVYSYRGGPPRRSIGFTVAHSPSNVRLVWGMKRLPDAKAVAKWCHEACPSPSIERTGEAVSFREEAHALALRDISAAVEHARHCRMTIAAQRKRLPMDGCQHEAGYVCRNCEYK